MTSDFHFEAASAGEIKQALLCSVEHFVSKRRMRATLRQEIH